MVLCICKCVLCTIFLIDYGIWTTEGFMYMELCFMHLAHKLWCMDH